MSDNKIQSGNIDASAIHETDKGSAQSKKSKKKKGRGTVFDRKAKVGNYKRKGVPYGAEPPPLAMKVNAHQSDTRMLDETRRNPMHKVSTSNTGKHTLRLAEYEETIIEAPAHLTPQPLPEKLEPVDPKCYKVEMPVALKEEVSAHEQAAHEYYLTQSAARKEAARHMEAKRAEEALTVMEAPPNHLTPNDIASMRSQVFHTVISQTARVANVLNGDEKWNPQQVRLYGMLLNKVLPDLHHSYSEVAVQDTDVNKLSRQELEAIIASSANTDAAQSIVESDYAPSFDDSPDPEPVAPVIITPPKDVN
jgi:hypothetical protein